MPPPRAAHGARPSPRALKYKPSNFVPDEFFKVEELPPHRDIEEPMSRIVHKRQSRVGQADEAYGDRVMSKGEHRFVFTIHNTHHDAGTGILLGVAAADRGDGYARRKWGVRVSDGRLVSFPTPDASSPDGRDSKYLAEAFIEGQQMRAVGRRVEVVLDLDLGRLAFSVDGALAVDSGAMPDELPEALVPWVQVFYKNDAVILSHHRSRPTFGSPPSPPPVRVPKHISRAYDNAPFEAGPWTP